MVRERVATAPLGLEEAFDATAAGARPVEQIQGAMPRECGIEEPPLHNLRLTPHTRLSPFRNEIENFIAAEFAKHFGADVDQFMPTLLGMHDAGGRTLAAAGCRAATAEPLFLEVYTQEPIEQAIERRVGVSVPRDQIVEIGSLACRDVRAAMAIVTAIVPYLIDAGYTWVVFTGADTVIRVFRRLQLYPIELCVADKALLGDRQYSWGSYYDHSPTVMAGRLLDGVDALQSMPRVQ